MADTTLGQTDYAKEMGHWNKPYVHQEFPKRLYMGTTTAGGRVTLIEPPREVTSEREEAEARAAGWDPHPQRALDAETARQEAIGTAAAERAYTDQRMSGRAQAEAAAADQAAGARHLGAIPERPRRPRPSRAKEGSGA